VRKNELFFSNPDIKLKENFPDGKLNWTSRYDNIIANEGEEELDQGEDIADNSAISFARKDKDILVKVSPTKQPLITSFSIYLFGYKKQVAFPLMPKNTP
jgi:hypothetical protein